MGLIRMGLMGLIRVGLAPTHIFRALRRWLPHWKVVPPLDSNLSSLTHNLDRLRIIIFMIVGVFKSAYADTAGRQRPDSYPTNFFRNDAMTFKNPNLRPGNHTEVAEAFAKELADLGIDASTALANQQVVNLNLCRETQDRETKEMGRLSIYRKKDGQSSMSTHLLKDLDFEQAIELCWRGDHDCAQRAVDEITTTPSSVPDAQAYVGGRQTEGEFRYFAVVLKDDGWAADFSGTSDTCDLYAQMDGLRSAIEWCAEEGISELAAYVTHQEMRGCLNGSKPLTSAPAQQLVLAVKRANINVTIWHLDDAPDKATAGLVLEVPAYV